MRTAATALPIFALALTPSRKLPQPVTQSGKSPPGPKAAPRARSRSPAHRSRRAQAEPGTISPACSPRRSTGVVYNDPNDDGIQETGEAGIPNVTLTLTGTTTLGGTVSLTTTTNASGQYSFTGLAAGTYTVTETLPTGDLGGKTSAGSLGGTASATAISHVVIPNGVTATAYNFPVISPAQLSGTVYTDVNDNGVEDSNETGLINAILTLTGTDDLGMSVNLTTQTNAEGAFSFTGLRPGDYTLVDTPPGNDLQGKTIAGTQGGTVGLGTITGITLTASADGEGNFLAVIPPAQISGLIYEDLNDNGVQDPGEPALAGAVVTITGTNDLGASVTESETTGSNGTYDFTDLRPGSYSVGWTLPPGLAPGSVAVGRKAARRTPARSGRSASARARSAAATWRPPSPPPPERSPAQPTTTSTTTARMTPPPTSASST